MELKDLQKSFLNDAKLLGDFQAMSKTELANGYCDEQEAMWLAQENNQEKEIGIHSAKMSSYFSALMLRYWYKIFEWSANSSSLNLSLTDFVDWLYEGLQVAFYYKAWRYENEAIVQYGKFIDWKKDSEGNLIPNSYYYVTDPNAPDKIINRCCASMRGKVYQYHNKDKRKLDVHTYSLDAMEDDTGDAATSYAGAYVENPEDKVSYLIDELIKRHETVEALIVDGIANYNSYKKKKITTTQNDINIETGEEEEVKVITTSEQFDPRKLVKHLNLINESFVQQFCRSYNVTSYSPEDIYNRLKGMNNTKLYKYIQKTLLEIRQTPELLDCLL